MFKNVNFLVLCFVLGLYFEEDKEVLESVFVVAFSVGLKREFLSDLEDARDLKVFGKIFKKG